MTAKEVANELLKTPDAQVLIKVNNSWVEVSAVKPTGVHRNAVTLDIVGNVIESDK
jgi:hypothetical protein